MTGPSSGRNGRIPPPGRVTRRGSADDDVVQDDLFVLARTVVVLLEINRDLLTGPLRDRELLGVPAVLVRRLRDDGGEDRRGAAAHDDAYGQPGIRARDVMGAVVEGERLRALRDGDALLDPGVRMPVATRSVELDEVVAVVILDPDHAPVGLG